MRSRSSSRSGANVYLTGQMMSARFRVRSVTASELARRRGSYGVGAPYVPLFMGTGTALALVIAIAGAFAGTAGLAVAAGYFAFFMLLSVADHPQASSSAADRRRRRSFARAST